MFLYAVYATEPVLTTQVNKTPAEDCSAPCIINSDITKGEKSIGNEKKELYL